MARTIQVLPDHVANQIAAGEVVERPASVVKELVENALDAGASEIRIHLEAGGRRSIRVADDGSGMGREDALLSLDRHATSKIRQARDLLDVTTLGFRGEALPSIASVSRFTLETRSAADEVGTRVRVHSGTISQVEDVARTPGTTVTVERLFGNAPARAKFLKSPSVETRAVSDVVSVIGVANPGVAIRLTSDERPLLELPASGDVVERIGAIWGFEAAGQLLSIDFRDGEWRMRGVIQRPDAVRPGFRRSQLFLGRRPFREPALIAAADRGYLTTIPQGHRPWVFLFFEPPAGAVDVNVHPAKAEVRFRDRSGIEAMVERGIRAALETLESAATLDVQPRPPTLRVRESVPEGRPLPEVGESQMALFLTGRERGSSEARSGGGDSDQEEGSPGRQVEVPVTRPRLWQVHQSWILAEVRDGLLLIDQHAAHERVLFERLMQRFRDGGEEAQRLLFPLTIRMSPAEVRMVEDLSGLLRHAGFEVEGFGGDTVIVHSVPHPHPQFDAERCFREMMEELVQGSELTRAARSQHERVAMSFACKAAIKAGQPLDDREIQELFDQLFATELPYHDVHGRPTTVRLSRSELERKFGR
jgi:DNA mismatch repair protein MutL